MSVATTPRRPSGLDWAPSVPAHWTVAPLRTRFGVQLGKMLDEKQITGAGSAPYLRNVDVQWGRINTDQLPRMDFSPADRTKFTLRRGDLLVCEGGEIGRAAIWTAPLAECFYQKALHRLRPLGADDPRFMFYLLFAGARLGVFSARSNASTIEHLTAEKLRAMRFPFPPVDEQRAIVEALDERLEVVRRAHGEASAVASRAAELRIAVTEEVLAQPALRDNACPAEWTACRLKNVVRGIEQGWSPQCEAREAEAGEWGVLKVGCVNGGRFRESEHKALPAGVAPNPSLEVRPGDVLVSRGSGSRDLVGSAAYVDRCRPNLMLSDLLFRLHWRPDRVEGEFLALALGTRAVRTQIEAAISGSSGLANKVRQETLWTLRLNVPAVADQRRMLADLRARVSPLIAAEAEALRTAELLKEREIVMVLAGVTGALPDMSRASTYAHA